MTRSYTLQYSERLARAAARAYVFHFLDWKFIGCVAILAALLVHGLATGERSMMLGFVAAAIAFFVVTLVYSLFSLQARASRIFVRLNGAPITLEESGARLKFSAPTDSYEIAPSDITQLRRHKDFFLLLYRGGGYATLPVSSLGADGVSWIESFVSQAGGKVV